MSSNSKHIMIYITNTMTKISDNIYFSLSPKSAIRQTFIFKIIHGIVSKFLFWFQTHQIIWIHNDKKLLGGADENEFKAKFKLYI